MTAPPPVSIWSTLSAEPDIGTSLLGDTRVDVAIIGGGYTGLSTALHCAEKGLSAHVLEAREIGYGGSGRNVGLVNAGSWLPPSVVKKYLGETYGPRFLQRFGEAPEYVFSLIERFQIRCEATRAGTIHAAHSPTGFRNLQGRHADWQALGAPVELLDKNEAETRIGSSAFHGGLLDKRAGTINPMGYTRGLARAAQALGAKISTGVTATALRREGDGWVVETDQGPVRAANVVLGTNAYTDGLWPGLERVFTPIYYFQMATTPLGQIADLILSGGQGLWDTGTIMFSLRKDAEGRLIIGSMGRLFGDEHRGLSQRWARKKLAQLFPELGPVRFESAWDGRIAMTPDHLPRVCVLDQGLYTAIGYNGRGVTTGTVFGQAMADLLTGMSQDDLPLPVTPMKAVPSAPIMSRAYDAAFIANQLFRSL